MMNFASQIPSTSNYIPTLNRMGYMSPALDEIQRTFVTYCQANLSGNFLDIGCGFGIATLPVINGGGKITACDLDEKHLEVLQEGLSQEKLSRLTLITGHFPDEVIFPKDTFEAINISMVLHFFPPPTIEKAFQEIFLCLKKGGRLFLTTSSPYQRALSPFLSTYEKKQSVEEWPGYIADIEKYVPQRAPFLPKQNIVFCPHELTRLASKFGFHVLVATFFSREGIPPDLSLDGREYSGIICEKPKEFSGVFLEKNKAAPPTQAANRR